MTARRIAAWCLAAVAAIAAAAGAATGVFQFMAVFVSIVVQSLFPATVSWGSHVASVKCSGAIADATKWPENPAAACAAMRMCANESVLSESQSAALEETIGGMKGCVGR